MHVDLNYLACAAMRSIESSRADPPSKGGLCQPFAGVLPQHVLEPGAVVGHVTSTAATRAGLTPGCVVCAGTTGGPPPVVGSCTGVAAV